MTLCQRWVRVMRKHSRENLIESKKKKTEGTTALVYYVMCERDLEKGGRFKREKKRSEGNTNLQ